MKPLRIPFLFLLLAVFSLSSCKNNETPPDDSKEAAKEANEPLKESTDLDADIKFAINATDAGLLQVQLAQLASTKSKNQQITDMSKMIEEDHSKMNNELSQAATSKNITVPSALSEKSNEKFNELNSKQGADFDKEYLKCVVDAHESAVRDYEHEAKNGNDPELKAWASAQLAGLQQHLDQAKALKDQMK